MNSTANTLCFKCKGFFASTQGLCSVCYKLTIKNSDVLTIPDEKKEIIPEEKNEEKLEVIPITVEKAIQEKTDSCWKCQKKIGYLGFNCRCKYTFCNLHRHFNDHNCDFDYKTLERERLKKENPLISTKKV